MQHRRSRRLLAIPLLATVGLAACGSDSDKAATTTAGAATTTAGGAGTTGGGASGGGVTLSGICPDVVTIQTDWMPEAEHGFVYQLVGPGYEIDKSKAYVTGPLIDQDGKDTGVKVQIRSGGSPQNFQPVTQIMYANNDVFLGYVYTDEGIQFSGTFPTVAIESGYDKNPQMIMWDPATYPKVTDIAGLGKENVKIRYFGGAAYMDYFTATDLLSKSQVDGSYTGDPSLFIADEGKSAQQGFGSSEPYLYEHELQGWMKPVKYQYINDAGWENYSQSIATKPENVTKYADCFAKLVPIIQHATIDYMKDPARTNAIILDAATTFGADFGWTYTQGAADYAAKTIAADKLVANGPDGTVGKFDMDRVTKLIDKAIPVYTAQGSPPKSGVKAEDVVTNQFIQDGIGL